MSKDKEHYLEKYIITDEALDDENFFVFHHASYPQESHSLSYQISDDEVTCVWNWHNNKEPSWLSDCKFDDECKGLEALEIWIPQLLH